MQAYNGQAVVDEDNQIIVGADVSSCASDCPSLDPMLDEAETNTGTAPREALADAGYCSADNLASAEARQPERGTETFMATGRLKHDEPVPPAPRGRIPKNATAKQRMARKLRTKRGRAAYARRKVIAEPVFGQLDSLQDGKRLLLRGMDGARGEWRLLAACHRFAGTAEILTSGTKYDEILAWFGRERGTDYRPRANAAVLITVTRAEPLISPAYDDGSSQAEVSARWRQRYLGQVHNTS